MDPNLQELHGNVKRIRTCFEKLAREIMTKLNECDNCIQTAEYLCEQVVKAKTMLDDKLINVNNDEKEWKVIKLKLVTTAIAGKQWQLERDPDIKSVFIDRDGKLFSHIIAYLRTNTLDFFRLHTLIHILTEYEQQIQLEAARRVFFDGTLLRPEHTRKLNEFYDGGYKGDTNAFLFTLINPHSIPPTKYLVNHTCVAKAVHHGENNGPTFGNGRDLYLSNGSNTNNSSYSAFLHTYIDTTGKGNETFTGADKFMVSDIEVFKLV
ncbi:unnamed protein product [Adineta ricciae]|uniref:TLDc domain-containing protein n=1 Tax=Adineta ricciae TaxID=249248 RepID=A0A815DRN3_ADIRI|nr:unnamed protein product [Adineta ricciae]